MQENHFSFRKRVKSFLYAFQGIKSLITHEHNARIHAFATVLVCLAGYFLNLSAHEWICVVILIGSVLAAEAFNTAIEKIADFISPERHPVIKEVKDVAAAGVLFTAIAAAIAGLIIFVPKIILLFQ
ncbi:MAG: diacylglycerol kinase family protein [Tannerellaceae bacterium]|nr:diacylglycerol kinase family protein [Tannerellaceae bacterium]